MSNKKEDQEHEDAAGKEAAPEGTAPLVLRFIQPHSAVNHDVEVDFTAPVLTLKEEMESQINVPAHEQEWFYKDAPLPDSSSLVTFVHYAGATVVVRRKTDPMQESSTN